MCDKRHAWPKAAHAPCPLEQAYQGLRVHPRVVVVTRELWAILMEY